MRATKIVKGFLSEMQNSSHSGARDRFWRYTPQYLDNPFQHEAMEKCYVAKAKNRLVASFIFYMQNLAAESEDGICKVALLEENLERIVHDLGLVNFSDLCGYIMDTVLVIEGEVNDDTFGYSIEELVEKTKKNTGRVARSSESDTEWVTKTYSLPVDRFFYL